MRVDEALRFAQAEPGLPAHEARMLLAHASGLSQVALIAHPEAVLDAPRQASYAALVARRRAGEPVAYLLGEREFFGLSLAVGPAVLIPRPETELLVDLALAQLGPGGRLLDLGTGSGAVALAVKAQRPDARVSAVDASAEALATAQANAVRHGLEVEFLHGDWCVPVAGRRFNLIAGNPPYIAEGDRHLGEGDLRHEPRHALVGGPDGLDCLRRIVLTAPPCLYPGGWLMLEHGHDQAGGVRELFEQSGFLNVRSENDLAGIARCTIGQYYSE